MLDYLPYFSIALVLIGATGLGWWRLRIHTRPRVHTELPQDDPLTVISEWKPTGKIDFGCCPELPEDESAEALFYLRVEELRLLESLTGTRRVEMRWRNATLAEAKQLASHHNARSDLPYVERLAAIRSASIVPDLAPTEPDSPVALIKDWTPRASRVTLGRSG